MRLFGEHAYAVDEVVRLTPDMARAFLFDDKDKRLRTAAQAA